MSRPPPSLHEESDRAAVPAADDAPNAGSDLTWGVGAVSTRLSVAASTLRTWERRYGVGPTFRTQGGHRRYTERDIDRVELMRRLVGRGVSAQDAARVARTLDREEIDVALTDELSREPAQLAPDDVVDAILAAAAIGNLERLSQLFVGLLRNGSFTDAWRNVLSPALVRMSCETSTGALPAGTQEEAIAVLVRELGALTVAERLPAAGRAVVLMARNAPEAEALPMLALEAALVQAGVPTASVGPDTSARAVATLVSKVRPRVLVTWGHPPDAALRRAIEARDDATFVVRALPAWPHELSLRFGFDAPPVSTDVGGAVAHLLDRVT